MSTAPHSPPQTPLKPTMAVEKENLQSPDIPLNNDAHRPPAETPSKATKQTRSSPEVQVLCSLPHNDHGDRPVNNAVHQPEQIRSDPSDAQTEVTEDHPEPETEDIEPDYNTKLPDMDWADFENRYDEAIAKASKEEQDLLAEFEKYAEVFGIWSRATARRDNERGLKRLKTRQRYVELAEMKLDDKKKHYEEVVQAFQKALELLRAPH